MGQTTVLVLAGIAGIITAIIGMYLAGGGKKEAANVPVMILIAFLGIATAVEATAAVIVA